MFTKVPRVGWTVLGILLTGFLAPAGVRHLDDAGRGPPPTGDSPAAPAPTFAPAQALAPSTTRVRAAGTGPTPEAAFQSAVDTALRQAVAAEVSAADWQHHGPAHLAAVRQDGTGVVSGWREVSSGSERHLTGRFYRSDVAVEMDVKAMRERLNSARPVTRR